MAEQLKPATHLAVPARLAERIAQHLQAIPGQPFLDELQACTQIHVAGEESRPGPKIVDETNATG